MATVRSVDFLPEIFQTDANKQFLAATLDQLIQEPQFAKTQGFIGRRVGPGVNPDDRYIVEPDAVRTNYQLEPGVVSLVPDTNRVADVITYPGINDAIGYQQGPVNRPDRLYTSEYYSWDPFVDFDTFVKNLYKVREMKFNHWWNPLDQQMRWLEYQQEDGTMRTADYIFHVERLDEEFQVIQDYFDCYEPLQWWSPLPEYKEFYNDETKAIVADLFAEDIERLGYTFER